MTSPLRESFVERWGEVQARVLETACDMHIQTKATDPIVMLFETMFKDAPEDHRHDNRGSDPFRYVILAVIGYECVTNETYAGYHGITVDPYDFMLWVTTEADLDSYDGDPPDHLSMIKYRIERALAEQEDRS